MRDARDRGRGHAALRGDCFRRIALVEITFRDERKHRLGATSVRQIDGCEQRWCHLRRQTVGESLRLLIPDQRIVILVAYEQAIAGIARRLHYEPRRVGVTNQEFPVDQAALEQDVDHCQR